MIQAHQNGAYLILFQVLLSDGSLLPETGIAFSILTSHDNLLEIRQCLDYPEAHRVTLKRAMLDIEGNQWQSGALVSHDRVDAVLRWRLVQQLKD